MWPFRNKAQRAAGEIKSATLMDVLPSWRLFRRNQAGWNVDVAIRDGYEASSIVYACVEKRAKLIASVPWQVFVKRGKDWHANPDHELQRLIDSPNPDFSFYELMYGASQSLDLAGNAFISELRAGVADNPQELWLLPARSMRIVPGRERLVERYEFTGQGGVRKIDARDMIHLKLPNPSDPIFGQPVLKAAARPTDIDRESGDWQKSSLQNRGASDLNFKVSDMTTKEQIDDMRAQYAETQAGPANARRALITSADVQNMGQTAVELDFIASRRSTWTEICAAFGMSLANLGMTEAVNLANAETMEKSLWQNTIIPQLELIKRQLNKQLASDYGEDVALEYDLSNVEALQESQDTKIDQANKLWAMGVPFNAINQHLEIGMDDVEGGDTGYISSSLLPADFEADWSEADE